MIKKKPSDLSFWEVFFVFDFHPDRKDESYSKKIKTNQKIYERMLEDGSLTEEEDENCGSVNLHRNCWEEEFKVSKRKYGKLYETLRLLSYESLLFRSFEDDGHLLVVYDPERKYKDVTFEFQEDTIVS